MAILIVIDIEGDTRELQAHYDQASGAFGGRLPQGALAHIAVPVERGIRVFHLMESDTALTAAAREFQPTVSGPMGLARGPHRTEIYDVHSYQLARPGSQPSS
jgi:hypothetical protein